MKYKVAITNRRKEILREEFFDTELAAHQHFEKIEKIRRPLSYQGYDMNLGEFSGDDSIGSVMVIVSDPKAKKVYIRREKYRYENNVLASVLVRDNETLRSCDRICDLCGGKVDKEDKFIDEEHCENCGWS